MKKGFTLVEIMVAVTIFVIVMTISTGALLSIFHADRKSQSLRVAMQNLNQALETMSREIRFGTKYQCGTSWPTGNPTPTNCSSTGISFFDSDGVKKIQYKLVGSTIIKRTSDTNTEIPVTSPEINISSMLIVVEGSGIEGVDQKQPRVFIKIKGKAGIKAGTESEFAL